MQFLERVLYAVIIVLFILFVRWASVDIMEVIRMRAAVGSPFQTSPVEGSSDSAETPLPSQKGGQE